MTHQDSGTSAKLPATYPKHDYLFRASGTSLETLDIYWVQPTSAIAYSFMNFLSVLLEIIESQSRQLEFEGYYISYLLGHIDEKEFEDIAKKYVPKKTEIGPEQLKNKVEVLSALRGHDITIREMAQYLHCDEADIKKAIQLLQR